MIFDKNMISFISYGYKCKCIDVNFKIFLKRKEKTTYLHLIFSKAILRSKLNNKPKKKKKELIYFKSS